MNHLKYLSNTSFRKLKLKNCQRTHKIHIQSKLDGTEKLLVTEVEYKHFIRLHPINQPCQTSGYVWGRWTCVCFGCLFSDRQIQTARSGSTVHSTERNLCIFAFGQTKQTTHTLKCSGYKTNTFLISL